MFALSIILLLVGVGLLCLEMFLMGFGISGLIGVVLIIVSAVLTVIAVPYGFVIIIIEFALIGVLAYFMLDYIKKHQLHGKIILDEVLNFEKHEIGSLDSFIGKEGITKTPLKPFGIVDFNGNPVEVYSSGSYITENKKVKVCDVSNNKIIVTEVTQNN